MTTLAMSWEEWARHDGVALADRVRAREVSPAELAAQAAAGIAKVDSALSGVVEVFEDVVADPASDGANLSGPFAGLPFLMKDLGPTLKGRLQDQIFRRITGNEQLGQDNERRAVGFGARARGTRLPRVADHVTDRRVQLGQCDFESRGLAHEAMLPARAVFRNCQTQTRPMRSASAKPQTKAAISSVTPTAAEPKSFTCPIC